MCKSCGFKSCFNYGIPWHEGYTCDEYDAGHPNAVSLVTSEERVRAVAKKCPGAGCMFYIEKDGGCDSMYCSHCGNAWNWGKEKFDTEKAKEGSATAAA